MHMSGHRQSAGPIQVRRMFHIGAFGKEIHEISAVATKK
jgi:hypothetical protein